MTDTEKALIPCFLCGNGVAIRYSKRQKPYLICDPCGIQTFVRGKRGIQLLSELRNSLQNQIVEASGTNNLELSALTNRLAELKALLEKTESNNWLDSLIWKKEDPVAEAIKSEIKKIEEQLREMTTSK